LKISELTCVKFETLSITHLFFKVRSTVIFVENAIKTFATNVAVLRTSKRIFYRVFYKDCGATHLEKEMGNGQRLKLDASFAHLI
jgi:hypothetical protein